MPQLIYRGYNTLVNLEKADGNISCTSVNVSTNHTLIESQGAYGGDLNVGTKDANIGIKSPFRKDYPNISCSLSFQPTFQQYKNIMEWLKERHKPTKVIIKTCENSDNNCLRFDQCYLQRLSINVSQDSFLTMEVDLYVRDTYDSTTLKYGGKHTNKVANSNSLAIGGIKDLNNKNKQFIPYYYTGIKTNQLKNYLDDKLMSWNVSFTQNIIKKTFCCGDYDKEAPLPQYIMFGVLSIDCSIQLMIGIKKMDQSDLLFDVQFNGDQQFAQKHDIQFLVHNTKPFELLGCQLNSVTPNVGQMNQVYTASMNFSAYGLKI